MNGFINLLIGQLYYDQAVGYICNDWLSGLKLYLNIFFNTKLYQLYLHITI